MHFLSKQEPIQDGRVFSFLSDKRPLLVLHNFRSVNKTNTRDTRAKKGISFSVAVYLYSVCLNTTDMEHLIYLDTGFTYI